MSSDPKVVAGRGAKARGIPVPQHYPSNTPFPQRMPFSQVPGYQGPPHPWYPMHSHADAQASWPGQWNPAMGYPMPSSGPGGPVPPWIRPPQGIRSQSTNSVSMPMDDNCTIDAIKRTYSNAYGAIEIQRVKVHRSAKDPQLGKPPVGYPVFDTGGNTEMSLVPAGSFGSLNERRPPPRKNRKKKLMQQQNQMPTGPQGPYQWYPYTPCMPFSYPYPYTGYAWPGPSETENSTEDNERSDSLPLSFDDSQRLDSRETTRDSLTPDRSFSRASSSQITEVQSLAPSDSISVRGYKREHSMERALMAPTPPPRTRSRASEDFPSSEISKTQDWMIEMQKALAAADTQRALAENMSDKTSSFTTAPSADASIITDLDTSIDIHSSVEDTRSSADLSYSFGKFEKAVDVFRISLNGSPTNSETQTLQQSSESDKTPTGPEDIKSIVPLDPDPIIEKTNPHTCLTQSDNSSTTVSTNTCMDLVPTNTCMDLVPVRPARAKRKTPKMNKKIINVIKVTSENSSVIVAKDKVEVIAEDIKMPEIKLIDRVETKDLSEVSVYNKENIEPVDLNISIDLNTSIDIKTSLDEVRISDISGLVRLEEENKDGRLSSASTDTFHSLKVGDTIDTDSTDILLPTSEAQTTADEGGNLTDSTAILSGGDGVGDDGNDYRWVLMQSGEAPELATAPSEGSDDDRKNAWRAQVSLWRARLIVSLCRGRGLDRQDWATFNLMVHHPLTLDLKLSLIHAPRMCQANSSVGAALVRVALIHLVTYGETLLQPEQARSHGWKSIRLDPSLPWAPVKGSVEILKALGYKQRDDVVLRYPRRSGPEVSVLARITLDMLVLSEELRLYLTGNHKYPSNVSDLFFPADSSDYMSPSPMLGERKLVERPDSAMSYDFVSAHSLASLDNNKIEKQSSVTDDETDTLQDSVRIVNEESRKDSVEISSEEEPTLKEDVEPQQESLDTKQLETSNVTLEFNVKDIIKDPGKPPKSPVPKKVLEEKRTSISSLASSPLHFDRRESVATDVASLPDLHSMPSTPVSTEQRLFTPTPSNISVTPVSAAGPNEDENKVSVTPTPSPVMEENIKQPECENKISRIPMSTPGSNKEENKALIKLTPSPVMEENIKWPESEHETSVTSVTIPGPNDDENKLLDTSVPLPVMEEKITQPESENEISVTAVSTLCPNEDENKLLDISVPLPVMKEMITQPESENKLSVTLHPSPVIEDEVKDSNQEAKEPITGNNETNVPLTAVVNSDQSKKSKDEEKKVSPEPAVDHIYEEITEVRAKAAAMKTTSEPIAILPPPLPPKKKTASGDEDDCSLSWSYPPSNCSSLQGSLRGSTGTRRKKRRAPMPPNWMAPDGKEENNSEIQSESPRTENKFLKIKKQESYDDNLNPFYEEIGNVVEKPLLPAKQGEINNPFLEEPKAVGFIGKNPFYETITIKSNVEKDKKDIKNPYECIDKVKDDIKIEIELSTPMADSIKDNINEPEYNAESEPKRRSPRLHPTTAPPEPPKVPPLPPKMKNQLNVSKEKVHVQESNTSNVNFNIQERSSSKENVHIEESSTLKENGHIQESRTSKENIQVQESSISKENVHVQESNTSKENVHIQESSTSKENVHVQESRLSKEIVHVQESITSKENVHVQESSTLRENINLQESSILEVKTNEETEELKEMTSSTSVDVINDTEIKSLKEETNMKNENVFTSKVIDVSREEINISKEEISTSTVISTSVKEINVKQISSSSEIVNSLENNSSKQNIHKINIEKEKDELINSENNLSKLEVKKNTEIQRNGLINSSVKLVDSMAIENTSECESNSIMSNKTSEHKTIIGSESKDGNVINEIRNEDKGMAYVDDDDDDTMSQTSVGVLCFSLHEEEQSFPEQHNIELQDISLSIMEDDIDDTLSESLPLSDLEKEVIARVVERTASPQVPPDLPPKQCKKVNSNKEQGIAPKASLEDMDEIPYIDINYTNSSSKKEENIHAGPSLSKNKASAFLGAQVPFIDDLDEPPDCPPPPPPTSPPESDSETPKASPQETPHVSPPETPGNSPPETPHNSPPPSPTFMDMQEKSAECKSKLKEDIVLKESLKENVLGSERSVSDDKYEIPDTSSAPSVTLPIDTNAASISINDDNISNINSEVSKYTAQSETDKYEIPEIQKDEEVSIVDSEAMDDRYEIPEVAKESYKIKVSQMPRLPPRPKDLPINRRNSGACSPGNPNKPPRRRNPDTPPTPTSPTPPLPPRPTKRIDSSTPPALPPKSTALPMRPASSTSHFSSASQATLPSQSSSLLSTSSSLFRSAAASSTSLFRSAASTPFGSVKSSASIKSRVSTPATPPSTRPSYKTNNGKGRKSWPQVFCNCLYANTKNYDDIS